MVKSFWPLATLVPTLTFTLVMMPGIGGMDLLKAMRILIPPATQSLEYRDADLAERWEVLDQGRTYVLHLDPRATFSDGTPVSRPRAILIAARLPFSRR